MGRPQPWQWVRRLIWTGAVAGTAVVNGLCDSPSAAYVNPDATFRLQIPEGWMVHERTESRMAALLKATQETAAKSDRRFAPRALVAFSEFPLAAAVPFNSNVTISIFDANAADISLETFARDVSAGPPAGPPSRWRSSHDGGRSASTAWLWTEYRYEEKTATRRAVVRSQMAVSRDPLRARYVLITASFLDRDVQQYGSVLERCVASFHWGEG